jgi:hypothetical protein
MKECQVSKFNENSSNVNLYWPYASILQQRTSVVQLAVTCTFSVHIRYMKVAQIQHPPHNTVEIRLLVSEVNTVLPPMNEDFFVPNIPIFIHKYTN